MERAEGFALTPFMILNVRCIFEVRPPVCDQSLHTDLVSLKRVPTGVRWTELTKEIK